MNTIWSDFVQTTAELYESRAIRFTRENSHDWLSALGLTESSELRVLEVGCAGGLFCHRLAELCPRLTVVGLDRDDNHIAFARSKSRELGLESARLEFTVGDACAMPFEDGSFDLVFSHTVSEHVPPEKFYPEQHRILRPNGRIVVLSARPKLGIRDDSWNSGSEEERALIEKAWSGAIDFEGSAEIGKYSLEPTEYPKMLERHSFREVELRHFSVVEYAPDNASTTPEAARRQINAHRVGILAMVEKTRLLAPDSLNESERERLVELVNARFDARLAQYERGEKLWDFASSAILAASGIK